ncbi:hypothetical protein E5332_06270 [Enterorhabdus sp. NM05_H27]|nr:hypothetical protein E5332_06270 [Enterorhabdus sp. NM05_H27]
MLQHILLTWISIKRPRLLLVAVFVDIGQVDRDLLLFRIGRKPEIKFSISKPGGCPIVLRNASNAEIPGRDPFAQIAFADARFDVAFLDLLRQVNFDHEDFVFIRQAVYIMVRFKFLYVSPVRYIEGSVGRIPDPLEKGGIGHLQRSSSYYGVSRARAEGVEESVRGRDGGENCTSRYANNMIFV